MTRRRPTGYPARMHTLTDGFVHIFTFKDRSRLLSPIAHDLRLDCARFEVTLDDGRVRGRFPVDGIEVAGPVHDGVVDQKGFGKLEKGKVLSGMRKDVLRSKRHPEVIFAGHIDGDRVRGGLTLVGRTVDIELPVEIADGRVRGRVELTPSRWGIKPYKALLGALVVADRVEVAFDLAWPT